MNKEHIIVLILCFTILQLSFSCRKNTKINPAETIIAEWAGKEISFPEDVTCCIYGKIADTKIKDSLFKS